MKKRGSGFTLIEVMIVVAIIGILSALTLGSLAAGRTARDLSRSSREVAAALREAQNYALSGRTANIGENNCAYSVQGSGSTFTLSHTYGSSCTSGVLATYSLSRGVVFGSNLTASFSVPRGELMPGASANIALTKGGSTVYVCLSAAGRVLENGSSICP